MFFATPNLILKPNIQPNIQPDIQPNIEPNIETQYWTDIQPNIQPNIDCPLLDKYLSYTTKNFLPPKIYMQQPYIPRCGIFCSLSSFEVCPPSKIIYHQRFSSSMYVFSCGSFSFKGYLLSMISDQLAQKVIFHVMLSYLEGYFR